VVGYGEIWSARLMTQTMRDDYHRSAAFLDAREVLVVKPQGSKIEICWDLTKERLKKWFYHCRWCDVIIVTGFIARNIDTELPITLKRNGSDFSATIFAVLTKANSVTIWKDVDGMFTADPKKNPHAKFIPEQTYEEAEEASRKGAFVIQADCIEPAKLYGIPIFLRNCFKLECPGTRIGHQHHHHHPLPVLNEKNCNHMINDHHHHGAVMDCGDHDHHHHEPVMDCGDHDHDHPISTEDHLMDSIQNQSSSFPHSCSESDVASIEDHNILEIIV